MSAANHDPIRLVEQARSAFQPGVVPQLHMAARDEIGQDFSLETVYMKNPALAGPWIFIFMLLGSFS